MMTTEKKPTILFVDDDASIIAAMKRMFHPMRKEWDMVFTISALKALTYMETNFVDIIISDMRMPEMDGSELLLAVKERSPSTARYILSGYSDKDMIMKTIDSADQFLSKPCNSNMIKRIIKKALNKKDAPNKARAIEYISQMDKLPTIPEVHRRLTRILNEPDCSIKAIANVIQEDVAITAKIMQLVNSTFFGLKSDVTELTQAVTYLGVDVIKAIIITVGTFNQFTEEEMKTFNIGALYRHSTSCSTLCKKIMGTVTTDHTMLEDSIIAGLLHEIGILIFIKNEQLKYISIYNQSGLDHETLKENEAKAFGITHAEIGGVLLEQWGFSEAIVDAIYHHHDPQGSSESSFGLTHALYVADILERNPYQDEDSEILLDLNHLNDLNMGDSIEEWKNFAKEGDV